VPGQPLRQLLDAGVLSDTEFHRILREVGALGGLCYHGVNDVDTAGMMDFLNQRYRKDLETARQRLG